MRESLRTDTPALLEATETFATALYVGPGLEALAASLSGTQADRLVAFALPAAAKALRAPTPSAPLARIEIHPALLSRSSGTASLQDFNIKGYAALRPATGLKRIFPGLRETRQTSIDTISPSEALEQARLEGSDNLLILGASGFEMEVLDAVLPTKGQPPFSRIVLMLPDAVLYEGGSTGAALATRLEQAGYRRSRTDSSDPDMPVAAFDLDRAGQEARMVLAERDRIIAALTDRLDRLADDLKEVQAQRDRALTDAETALAAARAEAKGLRRELDQAQAAAQDLRQQNAALTAARAELQADAEAERADLAEITAEKDTAQHRLGDLEGALAAARAEAEGLRQELDQAQAAAEDLRQQNAALTAARAESQADAEAERADLAEITAEKDTAQHRLGDLEGALAAARAEAEGLHQEVDQAWAKCRELEDWIETSKVQHGAALAKAAETASSTQRARTKAEEDLTLALRLQGLRETDLDELKDRYRALKAENDQLADLLRTTLHSLTFLQGKKQGGKKTAKRT